MSLSFDTGRLATDPLATKPAPTGPDRPRRRFRAALASCAITVFTLPFAACDKDSRPNTTQPTAELRAPRGLLWDAGQWDFDSWR